MDVNTDWALRPAAGALRRGLQVGLLLPLHDRVCRPFDVEGREHLESLATPALFIANHASHLDTPTALRALPSRIRRRVAVAAAADYFYRDGRFGCAVSLLLNTFPFCRDGSPRASLERCAGLVEAGWLILMYPEGTRSAIGELQPLKGGIGLLARALGVPVVPLALVGLDRVLPKGCHRPRAGRVTVRIGVPITVPRDCDPRVPAARLQQSLVPLLKGVRTLPATAGVPPRFEAGRVAPNARGVDAMQCPRCKVQNGQEALHCRACSHRLFAWLGDPFGNLELAGRPAAVALPCTASSVGTGLAVGCLSLLALAVLTSLGLSLLTSRNSPTVGTRGLARATATAEAAATATTLARARGTATAAASLGEQVFGPADGSLTHLEGRVATRPARVDLADFVAEARFFNPYSAAERGWDYGMFFRHTGPGMQYRLTINSARQWSLYLIDGDPNRAALRSGSVPKLDSSEGAANHLRLVVQGDRGLFFVNDEYVASLDLAEKRPSGDVMVVTGVRAANNIAGRVTRYQGFTIRSLP